MVHTIIITYYTYQLGVTQDKMIHVSNKERNRKHEIATINETDILYEMKGKEQHRGNQSGGDDVECMATSPCARRHAPGVISW